MRRGPWGAWRAVLLLWGLALALGCGGLGGPPVPEPPPVRPVPAEVRRVDDLLEPIRARTGVPALAAGAVRGGELVAVGAVGRRALGTERRVTVEDRWHIGSDTKAMTATLMAVLVERGALRWDSTVGEVFDDLPHDAGWEGITLEQLLAHTGGAPAGLDPFTRIRLVLWGEDPPGGRRLLTRQLLGSPPVDPGHFAYSNAGYVLAGAMAERVTGRSWEALMRDELFAPLGMEGAGFGPPGGEGQPWGHRGGRAEPPGPVADNPAPMGPAGTVHLTLSDWARFAALHLAGARGEPTPLLTPATFAFLHRPREEGYALGWGVEEGAGPGGGRVLRHAGSNTLWFARIRILPDQDLALFSASNVAEPGGPEATEAAIQALMEAI